MDRDVVGAGAGEVGDIPLGAGDHQMDIDRQRGRLADDLDDRRPQRQVRHEVAVHDVDVDPVHSGVLHGPHLVREMTEVSGKDRGGDLFHGRTIRKVALSFNRLEVRSQESE